MRRLAAISPIGLASALVAAVAASGGTTVAVTSVVTAGATLSVAGGTPPSFGVTLSGADQTVSYTLPVIVVDARGGTLGWNLTVTSTTFTDGGTGTGHTFAANASTITGVTSACGTNSTCLLPVNNIANTNLGLPGASGTPVKFFNASSAAGAGRGTINVNATVAVVVPANVFAGTFTSTVTIAISSGP
jgi:WxL domain surface cell wall-binding